MKLSEELEVSPQKLQEIQDVFSHRGNSISKLEQQITDLFIKPSNVANYHSCVCPEHQETIQK